MSGLKTIVATVIVKLNLNMQVSMFTPLSKKNVVIHFYLCCEFLLGRFEEAVIEERRKAAEAMLLFTTSIPALYNSPQLKDFFRVRCTWTHI